ncbi:MAG TPA: hypothetical protein VGG15_06645 [Terriglobales bacterium]|jgi:pimeloyl-ACP methyl ester carboxylesterase
MAWLSGSRNLALQAIAILLICGTLPTLVGAQGIKLTPAQRARARGELPLTSFYNTPVPLPAGNPGDLIRSQPFDDYDLPDGISAVRILYHSVGATGSDVAASAVVLIPRGPGPKGGWPIIAWAHPFIAVARPCAPSLMRGLGSGSALNMYANLGYVVVATDYTGLGTAFRNAGFDLQSNATDVINAVRAARKVLPQLGAKWIAIGVGNGGASALSAAELMIQDKDDVGAISISGALDLKNATDQAARGAWQDSFAYLAYGIKTVSPSFRLQDMLLPKSLARYDAVTVTCSVPPLKTPLTSAESLKPGWESSKYVDNFFQRNTLGRKPASAPMLIISAEDSRDSIDARVVSRMCDQKDRIDFKAYPGVDPNDLIGTTIATQMAWIKARFEGRMTQNTCR